MSFTYDIGLSDNISKVRSLIDDTDSESFDFPDETIQAYLDTTSSNIYKTASSLCKSLSVRYMKFADVAEVDDIRLEFKNKAEAFSQLSKDYFEVGRNNSKVIRPFMYFGGVSKSNFDAIRDSDSFVKPKFTQDTIFHPENTYEINLVTTTISPEPIGEWLFSTGFWDDSGFWNDTATWVD